MPQLKRCLITSLLLAALQAYPFAHDAHATESFALPTVSAVSIDGSTSDASFTLDLGSDTLSTHQVIDLTLTFNPSASDIGSNGSVYVIFVKNGSFFLLDSNSHFSVWNGDVATLFPFSEGTALEAQTSLDLLSGRLNDAGEFQVFIGYDTGNIATLKYTPSPFVFTITDQGGPTTSELFAADIEPLVQTRCIVCHIDGGVATNSGLNYVPTSADSAATNFSTFVSFAAARSDALDYILATAAGGNAHPGGPLLAVGSSDYNKLQSFLDVLINGGTGTTAEPGFFTGVGMLSPKATLRRAAIILAGRAPTDAEYAAVAGGDDASLKATVRGLMQGENFHKFLLNGANDRLLVRGVPDDTFLDGDGVFPNYINTRIDLQLKARRETGSNGNWEAGRFHGGVDRGLEDSPLELIAHVVENERPYSEILTADYMMLNPIAAFSMGVTAPFNDPNDYGEFQPAKIDRYYSWSEDIVDEEVVELQERRILNPGSLYHEYPHAGVLNTQAFLFRYPTTATNRNRARSRWTFLHFLDIDIEKSAPRTTDPVALADTNNPTMFNQNCTVCHTSLDPVAGAYALYGEEGHFRTNGDDSLDLFYKYEDENSPYREGDVWYRDMREAGVFGSKAPAGVDSLQWLAQEIVQQPGFASATVKFWWPSVIGTDPLLQPEVESDANYQAKLMAFNAQSDSIQQIADPFRNSGLNLKDMLVELVMSPWFRASSVDDSSLDPVEAEAHAIADLGSERLLTPEQLANKTDSITGFRWQRTRNSQQDRDEDGLSNEFKLYYGGIDSAGVTKRSRDMTALMSQVAMLHAAESACPIVLRDFAIDDGQRKLFNGISQSLTPIIENIAEYSVPTYPEDQYFESPRSQVSVSVALDASPKNLVVNTNYTHCEWNEATQQCDSYSHLSIDRLDVRAPNGAVTSIEANADNTFLGADCNWYHYESDVGSCSGGKVSFPYTPAMAGQYEITAVVLGTRFGEGELLSSVPLSVGAETVQPVASSTAAGATAIKAKIAELYSTLHGKSYAIDSTEVDMVYQLYAQSWDEIRKEPEPWRYNNLRWGDLGCSAWRDYKVAEGLPLQEAPYERFTDPVEQGGWVWYGTSVAANDYLDVVAGPDPTFSKQAWVTVLTYLMSHYDYLYE